MKGSEERFIEFLEGAKKRFVIPVYQRNYDWKIEHCKQLYDDLVKIVTHKRKSHFFGSLVSVYNPDGEGTEFLIIDGQQRITTVSLLFLAMYNLINKQILKPENINLGAQIFEDYLVDKWQPKETRIKLKPIKDDQLAFTNLFDQEDGHIEDSNLTINYNYYYDRIQRNEVSIDQLFEAVSKLEIINIKLNSDDNPQLIFESLNSTGLDLSEGDKIRNYILMGLSAKDQEKYYEKYWNKIEKNTAYDVSLFIRDFLSIKQKSTPPLDRIYFKFKEYVEDIIDFDVAVLLEELLEYSRYYSYLIKANSPWEGINGSIYRLNRLKTTVIRPFLLEVFKLKEQGIIGQGELADVLSIVENYIFRRTICNIPTNALNKVFLMLHRDVMRLDGSENDYVEKLKYVLKNKIESSRFPDDAEFAEELAEKNIYNMRSEAKVYLLERLENAGTKEAKNIWEHVDKGDYSIEHIMPQQLTAKWKDDLGSDYEEIHAHWLHKLANLTLTAYNSKFSNNSFKEKRDMENGFVDSGLKINQWIGQQNRWTLAELEERNKFLSEKALKIWPYVETTYSPPEKPSQTISLEDDYIFTGKKLAKYSLFGSEQMANNWTDMYVKVLSELHQQDKSVLTKLALAEYKSDGLTGHFSTKKEDYYVPGVIDKNIFVWLGIDAQYKINVLKKVFDAFGINQNELIFYLDDKNGNDDSSGLSDSDKLRIEYWTYALPQIKTAHAGKAFANVNPSKSSWLSGSFGIFGVFISCVINNSESRVDFNMDHSSQEVNKKMFDTIFSHKEEIENALGKKLSWDRGEEKKSSRIAISLEEKSFIHKEDWLAISEFHAYWSKKFYDVLVPYLSEM